MPRVFVAFDVGAPARAALTQHMRDLAAALPGVRWVQPATLHLTLAFLGERDAAETETIVRLCGEAAQVVAPFELRLGKLGIFGTPQRPKVIWRGVDGASTALLALHTVQMDLTGRLAAAGLLVPAEPVEAQHFTPHLTLARLKAPLPPAAAAATLSALLAAPPAAANAAAIPCDALALMRSDLLPAGARYTALATQPLAPKVGHP